MPDVSPNYISYLRLDRMGTQADIQHQTGQAADQDHHRAEGHVSFTWSSPVAMFADRVWSFSRGNPADEMPLRSWNIEIHLLSTTGEDIPADCFEKAVYKLHETFEDRAVQSTSIACARGLGNV